MDNRPNSQATLASTHHENTSSYVQPSTNDSPHNSILSNAVNQNQQESISQPTARIQEKVDSKHSLSEILPQIRDKSQDGEKVEVSKSESQLLNLKNSNNNQPEETSNREKEAKIVQKSQSEAQMGWLLSQLENYQLPPEQNSGQNQQNGVYEVVVKVEEVTSVKQEQMPEQSKGSRQPSSRKNMPFFGLQQASQYGQEASVKTSEQEQEEYISNLINDQTKYKQRSIIEYCSNSRPPPQPLDIQSINGVYVDQNDGKAPEAQQQSASYKVRVTACHDDNIDALIKNNDIYGIEKESRSGEISEHPVRYSPEDDQKQNKEPDDHSFQQYRAKLQSQKLANFLHELSLSVTETASPEKRQEVFNKFQFQIAPHFDLICFAPLDEVGQIILSNGNNLIDFIRLVNIKQAHKKRLYQLHQLCLIQLLQKFVVEDREDLENYRKSLNGTPKRELVIVNTVKEQIEGRNPNAIPDKSDEGETYSMEVNNPSNRGDAKSFTVSQKRKKYKSNHKAEGPVKRIQFDYITSDVDFQDQSQEPPRQTQPQRQLASYLSDNKEPSRQLRPTRRRQYNRKKLQIAKLTDQTASEIMEEHLGTAYTYAQVRNGDEAYLQPVRASIRINNQSKKKQLEAQSRLIPVEERKSDGLRKSPRLSGQSQESRGKIKKPIRNEDSRKSRKKARQPSPQRQQAQQARPKVQGKRSTRKSMHRLTSQEQQQLNHDYIKEHFKQIRIEKDLIQSIYTPLSRQDQKVTKLLSRYMDLNQQQEQIHEEYQQSQRSQPMSYNAEEMQEHSVASRRMVEIQRELKKQKEDVVKKLSDYSLPIEIDRVVNPNINNHNIFALLQLGDKSKSIYKAKYVIARINLGSSFSRKDEEEDLRTVDELVEEEERGNVGWLNTDESVLRMVDDQVRRRELNRKRREAGLSVSS